MSDPGFRVRTVPSMPAGVALRVLRAFWAPILSIAIMLALWLAL